MTQNPISPAQSRSIVRILLCFMPLLGMGVDLIAPSLPAIEQSLHTSAVLTKNLISIYILGAALGTFLSGILSDAWGRRRLICGSFMVLTVISILPTLWPHSIVLLLSRFFQGIALGSFVVLIRSVVADLLKDEALLRTASWMGTIWGIGPIIGPMIGAYLQVYIGWQADFLFFSLYGLVGTITCLLLLPETHHHRIPLSFSRIKNNFIIIMPDRVFMSVSVLMGCLYAMLIIFNTLAPFFIQKQLGYSPIFFGRAAFCLGFIYLCGTFCCRTLVKRFPPIKILSFGIPVVFIFTLANIFISYNSHNVWTVLLPNAFLFFFCGVLYPTCMGVTMNKFRELAGSASAIVTLTNLLVTSSSGFIASAIGAQSAKSIAWISCVFIFIGLFFYFYALMGNAIQRKEFA